MEKKIPVLDSSPSPSDLFGLGESLHLAMVSSTPVILSGQRWAPDED